MNARRSSGTGNQGIQAESVHAEVLAVGAGARAIKTVSGLSSDDLERAIGDIRAAIGRLGVQPEAKESLAEDLNGLHAAATVPAPDRREVQGFLKNITEKLKITGTVIREVAELAEPVRNIATNFGIPLSLLGLG